MGVGDRRVEWPRGSLELRLDWEGVREWGTGRGTECGG